MRPIDADKLLEKVRYTGLDFGYTSTGGRRVGTITEDDIKSAPTLIYADLVPHGRWLKTVEPCGWDEDECAECSVCHESWIVDEDYRYDFLKFWNYCPNCGAKMDGGETVDS